MSGGGRQLDPPADVRPIDPATGQHSDVWSMYHQAVADRLSAGVIMQTGTSTSDPLGAISVTLPVPFNARTLGFQCDAKPAEPLAYFNQGTIQALPLDVVTGTLSKDSGGGTIVAVPNTDFTWFATGV